MLSRHLEAMQKRIKFYHNKGIHTLKRGCTLPNLAYICLHKSTNNQFYPFVEADKDLHDKIPVLSLVSLLEKRSWIKHIFETQNIFANQM